MRVWKNQSGQSMVLGAITLLCVALVTFMSLQVGHVIHEKIRVQNYADERAFSMAVQEARSFNYYAYTNRGIAASYVSIAAMHAYYSEVTMMADSYWSAAMILISEVFPEEMGECCSCPVIGCCKIPHCIHAIEAVITGAELIGDSDKPAKDVQALDTPFRDTVSALQLHAEALYGSQLAMRGSITLFALKNGSLANVNTNSANGFGIQDVDTIAENALEYNRAIDYTKTDRRKKLMAEISNATRSPFITDRTNDDIITAGILLSPWIPKIRKAAGNQGLWVITGGYPGRAGISKDLSPFSGDVKRGVDGKTISSFDYGELSVAGWHDGFGTWPLPFLSIIEPGYVVSGDGWKHSAAFESPHKGSDHTNKYRMEDFTEFNIAKSAPYNQPSVFAAAKLNTDKDLSGKEWPWLINDTGKVSMNVGGAGGNGTVQLADPSPVMGFSKAMVYYHRFGDWRDPPNFWNPYWRAKLDPLSEAEAALVGTLVDTKSGEVMGVVGLTPEKAAVNVK